LVHISFRKRHGTERLDNVGFAYPDPNPDKKHPDPVTEMVAETMLI
jgi:hypothetical protein